MRARKVFTAMRVKRRRSTIGRQPPVKGGRDHLSPCVLKQITECVQHTSDIFGVSQSWVVSKILGEYFGVKDQPDYASPSEEQLAEEKRQAMRQAAGRHLRIAR